MKFIKLFLLISLFYVSFGLPVIEKKEDTKTINEADQPKDEDWSLGLEYERYLKEVVQALESDPEFRKKLETADVEDIKSGKIAKDLHLVDHNVRTKLDELKRRELERLRHLAIKEHEKKIGVDRSRLKVPVHLDHRNPDRFESEDLSKLIQQVHRDIEKVEKEREEEFKRYELEKEYKFKHDLEGMDEDHKKQAISEHEETLKKHKDHPKLHHPGSKQQLEEVWEEQDHMNSEDFNPNTFFHLHDLDGNGYWDENEVKTLFQKELDKMYDPNAPEDDMNERYEEMERMRAHVFAESDLNKDNLISYDEFIEQTKKNDFERDEGWQGLDEQQVYSQQEYEEYERQRQMEMQRLVESGAIPPPPGYYGRNHPQPLAMDDHNFAGKGIPPVPVGVVGNPPHPGPQVVYQQVPQGYQQLPQDYHQVPQGYQQVPQGYQQVPQGYQQVPQGYQQMPQGYHQVPQGYQQVPQGHQQVPQGHQQVPQGYQQVNQGYQQVPQSSYQQVPAQDQKNQKQQPIAAPQSVPQAQAMPQAQAAPQAMPQAQAVPQAQALPQAIPQAQGPPKVQNSQSPQVQGQAQNVQHNQIGSKKDGQHPGETHPEINQQPPGIVLQNQQDHLNQLPEVKPIDNNHL